MPSTSEQQSKKHHPLKLFLISCVSLLIIWTCAFTILIYGVFASNTNILNFFKSAQYDSEFISSLFAYNKEQRPFTSPNFDYSTNKFYSLFASRSHGISLYYPDTHQVSDEEYSIDLKTYDDGIDSALSDIELKIIDLPKLQSLYKNSGYFTGAVKSTEIENILLSNFKSFNQSDSIYKPTVKIHNKTYDIKSYKSKSDYEYESELVAGCKNKTRYHLDTIFLNYNYYAIIAYNTGLMCDSVTNDATKSKLPDTREMQLTYSILDSLKFQDNEKEISEFESTNTYSNYKNKIDTLAKDLGVNIYFDNYPESFVKETNKYKWKKSNLENEFDEKSSLNTLRVLYQELKKYPKSFIKSSKIKTFAFVYDLEEPTKRELAGLTVPDLQIIFFDLSNIHSVASLPETLHHEIMHMIDLFIFYDRLYMDSNYWDKLNVTGDYVGIEKTEKEDTLYATNNYNIFGFATGYAKADILEDRAETFRFLMTPSDFKFSKYKQVHETQFKNKIERLKSQIKTVSPEMNETYFNSLNYD